MNLKLCEFISRYEFLFLTWIKPEQLQLLEQVGNIVQDELRFHPWLMAQLTTDKSCARCLHFILEAPLALFHVLFVTKTWHDDEKNNACLYLDGLADKSVGIPYRSLLKQVHKWQNGTTSPLLSIMRPPLVPAYEILELDKCHSCGYPLGGTHKTFPKKGPYYVKSEEQYVLVILSSKPWPTKIKSDLRLFIHVSDNTNTFSKTLCERHRFCSSDKRIIWYLSGERIKMTPIRLEACLPYIHSAHRMRFQLAIRGVDL